MTEQVIVLTRPPPSVNHMFRTGDGNRRYRSSEYNTWKKEAGWEVASQRPLKFLDDVAVVIELKRPRINADVDNRIKPALDLLTGLVWPDDRQVVEVTARWADIEGCRITVRSIS